MKLAELGKVRAAAVFAVLSYVILISLDVAVALEQAADSDAPPASDQMVVAEELAIRELKNAGASVYGNPKDGFYITIGVRVPITALDHLAQVPRMRSITLLSPKVTDQSLSVLTKNKGLQRLTIWRATVTDAGLAQLAQLRLLQIAFRQLRITDEGLSALASIPSLKSLSIHSCPQLTGLGLAQLRSLPHLQHLRLDGRNFTDAGLSTLRELPNLTSLEVRSSLVTDAVIPHIQRLTKLTSVRLHGTQITDAGVRDLKLALPNADVVGGSLAAGQENLRRIALALHEYHDKHGHFPSASVKSQEGQAAHSWRVAILPLLGEKRLYDEYRFNEPWDSDANRAVLAKMPAVYRSPKAAQNTDRTVYIALTGPRTAFASDLGTKISEIAVGTSNTLWLVEAEPSVPWTKPEDFEFDPTVKPLEVFGIHGDGLNVALADGAVELLPYANLHDSRRFELNTAVWQEYAPAAIRNRKAPDFTLTSLATGEEVTLSKAIAGKIAVLNFSAYHCAPCRIEAPHLSALQQRYDRNEVVVFTVNTLDEPAELLREYVQTEDLRHEFLLNGNTVATWIYRLDGWPATYCVNHEGVITDIHFGFTPGDEQKLVEITEKLLAKKRQAP